MAKRLSVEWLHAFWTKQATNILGHVVRENTADNFTQWFKRPPDYQPQREILLSKLTLSIFFPDFSFRQKN